MRVQREVIRAGKAGRFEHNAGGPGGILILSRLPILYRDSYVYKNRGHADAIHQMDWQAPVVGSNYPLGKGIQSAVLRLPSGDPVIVSSSHLVASYVQNAPKSLPSEDNLLGQRAGEVLELMQRLEALRRQFPSAPIAFVGDLNSDPRTPLFRYIAYSGPLRPLMDPAHFFSTSDRADSPYARRGAPPVVLDHILAAPSLEGRTALRPTYLTEAFADVFEINGKPSMVSDHVGIRAEMVLQPLDEEAAVPESYVIPDVSEQHKIDASSTVTPMNHKEAYRGLLHLIEAGLDISSGRRRRFMGIAIMAIVVIAMTLFVAFGPDENDNDDEEDGAALWVLIGVAVVSGLFLVAACLMLARYIPRELGALRWARNRLQELLTTTASGSKGGEDIPTGAAKEEGEGEARELPAEAIASVAAVGASVQVPQGLGRAVEV